MVLRARRRAVWPRAFTPPRAVQAAIVLFSSTPRMGAKLDATKTGLLIHGCHLGAKGWHNVMWGDAKTQRLGRLPHAVKLAWDEKASVVAIGTGASVKDGVIEGRYTLQYLADNWERLREFSVFAELDMDEVRKTIEPLLITDVKSKSTREELEEAGRLFREEGCTRVILVSSATHVPRCVRDACVLWNGASNAEVGPERDALGAEGERRVDAIGGTPAPTPGAPETVAYGDADAAHRPSRSSDRVLEETDSGEDVQWRPVILASPCGTSFTGYGPEDVAIIEPPHRGDDPALTAVGLPLDGRSLEEAFPEGTSSRPPLLHELVGSMIRVPRGEKSARFRRELDELLRRYLDDEN